MGENNIKKRELISLFEDNTEFGFGYRLSIDKQTEFAVELLQNLRSNLGDRLVNDIVQNSQKNRGRYLEAKGKCVPSQTEIEQNYNTNQGTKTRSKNPEFAIFGRLFSQKECVDSRR
ncbi:pyruvate flavodoxin/ferredoxin oxidoreductase domain protein [Raphidiopsis curvata NIES-932]|nr:pyruvate flavodoxin/ferredoxin oxidoreductase domain protein [Raphidiopsis curvata NIES-932]